MATIDERFAIFDRANPRVWELFLNFTNDLIARGWKRYSSDAVLHRIRWHYHTSGMERGGEDFAINNSFSSRYARKFQREFPGLADFFEVRRLKSSRPIVGAFNRHDREVNAIAV